MHHPESFEHATAVSCGIAVMAKASVPGRTTTRLVPPLTPAEAARFNTAFLQDVAANVLAASRQAPIACYMAYGPPGAEPFFHEILPPQVALVEAWLPDFGDCLFSAIGQLLGRNHASAVVLNSDSPTLPTSLLVETARLLAQPGDRAVLGPSTDGGYYLLGLKRAHKRLFEDIAWSTASVVRQTSERAREIGLPLHVLQRWYDVDDRAALQTLHAELCDARPFATDIRPHWPARTSQLMRSLLATSDFRRRLASEHVRASERAVP
jgi:rSAM/selenodomain-associated transferase 1